MRIVDHNFHHAQNLRGNFLADWQADDGARLDAPVLWTPSGSTTGRVLLKGDPQAYCLRTGHAMTSDYFARKVTE